MYFAKKYMLMAANTIGRFRFKGAFNVASVNPNKDKNVLLDD